MSDLALLVAAVLRDRVVLEMQKEIEDLQLELTRSRGAAIISVDDWKLHTRYTGSFAGDSDGDPNNTLEWFWEIMQEYDEDHLARMYESVTGSQSMPVHFEVGSNKKRNTPEKYGSACWLTVHGDENLSPGATPYSKKFEKTLVLSSRYESKDQLKALLQRAQDFLDFSGMFQL